MKGKAVFGVALFRPPHHSSHVVASHGTRHWRCRFPISSETRLSREWAVFFLVSDFIVCKISHREATWLSPVTEMLIFRCQNLSGVPFQSRHHTNVWAGISCSPDWTWGESDIHVIAEKSPHSLGGSIFTQCHEHPFFVATRHCGVEQLIQPHRHWTHG